MASRGYYTTQEDELLTQRYVTATKAELAVLFPGRSIGGLTQRASYLGLKKDKRYYENGLQAEESIIGHLSETEKAYLAGIIDADGCIRLNRRLSRHHQPVYAAYVHIFTTSPLLTDWLRTRFPGKCNIRDGQSRNPNWRNGWLWELSGNRRVMTFCREIAPYLIIKREQAELVVNGYVHLSEPERFALFQKMKDLKKVS